MTEYTPTHMSDALRPTIELCLESTRLLLKRAHVAADHEGVTMYENRVATLEELLR